MEKDLRTLGVDILGQARWGNHFCLFCETAEDLEEILVPYFKAGLEDREFCMWVTSAPLDQYEAEEAMRKAVPDFDRYLASGQMEIVPHTEWYVRGGVFDPQRVFDAWIDKLNDALARGYDGMRVTGNTAWLGKEEWAAFSQYEEALNLAIGKYRMIVICTYCLDRCGASEILDVVGNHQFALIRRQGTWERIEASEHKRASEALRESEFRNRHLFENMNDAAFLADPETGIILDVNKRAEVLLGRPRDELIGAHQTELYPPDKASQYRERFRRHVEKGQAGNYAGEVACKDGRIVPVMISNSGTFTVAKQSYILGLLHDVSDRRRIEGKLRRSHRELRKLAAYLQSAREVERLEVARTIHDELGQGLTALKMDVSWLARRLPKEAKELRERARDMALLIDATAGATERISTELRPALLDDLGLAAAVEWYVEDFQKHSGINCEVDVSARDVVLGRGPATAVFRILQEALRNVVRHAKATKVEVSLGTSGGKTVLKVRDNGIGIAGERVADSQAFGLLGMRERALSLGGSVRIRGRPGKGTTVTVTVPLSKGQGH